MTVRERAARFAGEGHTFITKHPQSPAAQDAVERMKAFIHERTDGRADQPSD